MDWAAWHQYYDDPASPLNARLRCVQAHLADAIDLAPPGRPTAGSSPSAPITVDGPGPTRAA
jgi:hypothetical protein